MPTEKEIAAGVAAIMPDLYALIDAYVPDMFGYRQRLKDEMQKSSGQTIIHNAVKRVEAAYDAAHSNQPAPSPAQHAEVKAGWEKLHQSAVQSG